MNYCGIDKESCRHYKSGKCVKRDEDCESIIAPDLLDGIDMDDLAQIVLAHSASIKKRLDEQAKAWAQIQKTLAGKGGR